MDMRPASAQKSLLHAIIEAAIERGQARIRQDYQVSERMIEAVAQSGHNQNGGRLLFESILETQFQVRLILVMRVAEDHDAHCLDPLPLSIANRIEVANHSLRRQAQGKGMTRSAVGAQDGVIGPEEEAGVLEIRQNAIGEDHDARHLVDSAAAPLGDMTGDHANEKTILCGGWSVAGLDPSAGINQIR
jgi:hypothetical protein